MWVIRQGLSIPRIYAYTHIHKRIPSRPFCHTVTTLNTIPTNPFMLRSSAMQVDTIVRNQQNALQSSISKINIYFRCIVPDV